jgi:hypothetical protein
MKGFELYKLLFHVPIGLRIENGTERTENIMIVSLES